MEFGAVCLAADNHVLCTFHSLQFGLEFLGDAVGDVEVVAINFHVDRIAAHAAAARCGDGIIDDFRGVVKLVADGVCNLKDGALAFPLLCGADVHLTLVVARRRHQRRDARVLVGAEGSGYNPEFGVVCHHFSLDAAAYLGGFLDSRTTLEFKCYGHPAFV